MLRKGSMALRLSAFLGLIVLFLAQPGSRLEAQTPGQRAVSGVVVTKKKEAMGNITVIARSASREQKTVTDADGNFRFRLACVGDDALTLRLEGRHVAPLEKRIGPG